MPAIKERAHALQLLARRHGRRIATVAAGLLALVLTAMFGPTVLVTVRLSLAVRSASPARIRSAVDAANALPNHLKPRNARHARITLFELGSSAVRRAMASKDLDELYAAARMCEIAFVNRYLVDAEIARVIKKRDDAAAALKAMEEARTVAAAAAARYADEEDAILAVSSDEALPAVSDGFSSEASARIAQVKNYLEPLEFQPDGWGAAATYRGETLRVLVAAEEEGGAGATEDAAAEEDAVKDAAGSTAEEGEVEDAGAGNAREDSGVEATVTAERVPTVAEASNVTNATAAPPPEPSEVVLPHGSGVLRTVEGFEYAGSWHHGGLSGACVTRWATGAVYYAGARASISKKDGFGTLLDHDGEVIHTGRFFNGSAMGA